MAHAARYADIVRLHHRRTTGYLLAAQVACRELVDQELERIDRVLRPVEPGMVGRFAPKGSWMLAVILFRRDDLGELARWASALSRRDLDRVRFYVRPEVDVNVVLQPWEDAGFGPSRIHRVRDFATFHKVFGKHLNDRVWMDHQGAAPGGSGLP